MINLKSFFFVIILCSILVQGTPPIGHDERIAKEFNYLEWRDKINQKKLHFHSEFSFTPDPSVWEPTTANEYVLPHAFIIKLTKKSYKNLLDTTKSITITIAVCESVIAAHRHLFSNLINCTNPYVYKLKPAIISHGDITIGPFWARDNISVTVSYKSHFNVPDKVINELDSQIDREIVCIPNVTDNRSKDKKKSPLKITLPANYIPIGEILPITLEVHDDLKSKISKPLIVAEGGRISFKNGSYFYVGNKVGPQSIEVFITLTSGETYSDKITFEVVE